VLGDLGHGWPVCATARTHLAPLHMLHQPLPGTPAHEATPALALLLSMYEGMLPKSRLLKSWALCHSCILHLSARLKAPQQIKFSLLLQAPAKLACLARSVQAAQLARRAGALHLRLTLQDAACMPGSAPAQCDSLPTACCRPAAKRPLIERVACGRAQQQRLREQPEDRRGVCRNRHPPAAYAAHAPGTPVSADG